MAMTRPTPIWKQEHISDRKDNVSRPIYQGMGRFFIPSYPLHWKQETKQWVIFKKAPQQFGPWKSTLKANKAMVCPRCLNKVRKLLDNNTPELHGSRELFPLESLTMSNNKNMGDCSKPCFQRRSESWEYFETPETHNFHYQGEMYGPLQKRHTEVVQGSQGQGWPLQQYKDFSPTHCRVIFHPSDTKWNGSEKRNTMGEGERSEKEQQVNWKQKYKQRGGNSGKVVSLLLASSRHSEVMSEKWWIRDHRQGQEQQGSIVWPEARTGK